MTDALVVGGGVVGLSVAWRAAQRGLSVTVVDPDPGGGASYAAAGMLAPVAEAAFGEERLVALNQASLALWPSFAAELEHASGREVGLRTAGTLVVGFDSDDVRELDRTLAFHQELGLDATRLTPGACRAQEPALTPRLRGGLRIPGDHSVEPRSLHAALLAAATALGVQVVRARAAELLVDGQRAVGVLLEDGAALRADQVVLALGAWSGALPGVPTGTVPVRPVKGQILRLQGEPLLTGTVRALVRGRSVYLVPYGTDRIVVGATVEEQGFDARVTAGAVHELLRDALEVVPGLDEHAVVETLARWRPGTPDNGPLLGACGLPGLLLATGHYRNGVLLAPLTGVALADVLAGGTPQGPALDFSPARFVLEAS